MASSIKGIGQVRRVLRKLPDDVTAELKVEIKTSADKVLAAMKSVAPHQTVRDNLSIKQNRDKLSATVGFNGKRAEKKGFLGRLFEFGVKPHVIVPRAEGKRARRRRASGGQVDGARFLANKGTGEFFGKQVQHPGMRKRPWMFGYWQRNRDTIRRRVLEAVARALRRA